MRPVTRQDELWKEDTGGTIRCHHCDWAGQADTIAAALALVRKHQAESHPMGRPDHVHFRGDEPHSHDPYVHPWGAHKARHSESTDRAGGGL